jgi:hypothetical protein
MPTPSDYRDPTTWRSQTASGWPFRYLDTKGNFGGESAGNYIRDNANVDLDFLVPVDALGGFLLDIFPPPQQYGDLELEQYSELPGFSALKAMNATFGGHIEGVPSDPFSADPLAPAGTYQRIIKVTVHYKTHPTPDPNDLHSFLEISYNTSGQYLNIGNTSGYWDPVNSDGAQFLNPEFVPDPAIGQTKIKDPALPVIKPVPMREWTIVWPRVDYTYFKDTLKPKLDTLYGLVNDTPFKATYDSPKETMLYLGEQYTEHWTWRGILPPAATGTNRKTIKLSMRFLQKRIPYVEDPAVVPNVIVYANHNMFWRKEKGWTRVFIGTGAGKFRYPFELGDFNKLFSITPSAP